MADPTDRERCPSCGEDGLQHVAVDCDGIVSRGVACICGWLELKGPDGNVVMFRTSKAKRIEEYLRDALRARQAALVRMRDNPINRGTPMRVSLKL